MELRLPPGRALLVWALALLGLAAGLAAAPGRPEMALSGAAHTPAARVERALQEDFGLRLGGTLAIVGPAAGAAPSSDDWAEAFEAGAPGCAAKVTRAAPRRAGAGRGTRLWLVAFDPGLDAAAVQAAVPAWRRAIARFGPAYALTGPAAFQADAKAQSAQDARRSEGWSLGVSAAVLVWACGSLSGAALPLLAAVGTLLAANGLLAWANAPSSAIATVLSAMMAVALSVDYALMILARYQGERGAGRTAPEALAIVRAGPVATVRHAAALMALALLPLLIPDASLLRLVVCQLLLVVGLSAFHASVVLPWALARFPEGWGWPAPLGRFLARYRGASVFGGVARFAVRRPWLSAAAALAVLAGLAAPALHLRLWEPTHAIAPAESPSRQAYARLVADGWGGELAPVVLRVAGPGLLSPEGLRALSELVGAMEARPEAAGAQALVPAGLGPEAARARAGALSTLTALPAPWRPAAVRQSLAPDGRSTLVAVYPRSILDREAPLAIAEAAGAWAAGPGAASGLTVEAGGLAVRVRDFTVEIYRWAPLVVALALGATMLLLARWTRSVFIPLKAALLNGLPLLAALGALALLYQDGVGAALTGIHPDGAVINLVPVVLCCVVWGLGMDYELLLLASVLEARRAGRPWGEAIREGLVRSGPVISGAALILVGVFGIGASSPSFQTQQLCLGITLALALDATLGRFVLAPALLKLAGRANFWWPFGGGEAGRPPAAPPGHAAPGLD